MKSRSKVLLLAGALAFGTVQPASAVFVTRKGQSSAAAGAGVSAVSTVQPQSFSARTVSTFKKLSAAKKKQGIFHRVVNKMTSKVLAAILAFFLGGFGVHRFYLGYSKQGLLQLAGTVLGYALYLVAFLTGIHALLYLGFALIFAVGIWAFVDFIRILTGGLEPANGSYD